MQEIPCSSICLSALDINLMHLDTMQGNATASSSRVQVFCDKQMGTRCDILQRKLQLCVYHFNLTHMPALD